MFKYVSKRSESFLLVGSLLSALQVLLPSGVLLSLQLFSLDLFGLLLENSLDQDGSVLELVTLGGQVKLVIDGSIDLLGGSVLLQQPPQDSLPAHPKDFSGHSAFASTSTFTRAGMPTEPLGLQMLSGASSGVYFLFALHDETVLDELSDEDPGVGLADLLDFAGVHPDSLPAALEHLGGKPFLTSQVDHRFNI